MNKYGKITLNGLVTNNAAFKLVLGTCSALAMSASAINGFGMGICVTVVLLLSNVLISLLRKIIPNAVRIPAFVVIIATLVTILKMFLDKFIPDLYDAMGVFLPLIVVNCLILGRAEAFASKQPVLDSALDGIASGLGFTAALTIMGIIRELLGEGSFFGLHLWDFQIKFFTNSAGAFFVYGICIALFLFITDKVEKSFRKKKAQLLRVNNGEPLPAPETAEAEATAKEAE
ncbi:MAG: electron transport complex subunit RsxE [Clostridia bacterium]|nr:electron transport complex subunit RsxE [Clostridia bacterium]